MKKNSKSPQDQFDPDRLDTFFHAIAIEEPFRRFTLETKLQWLFSSFWQQSSMGALPRKRLRQYLRASQKKRALLQALGPAVEHQIMVASYLRENPGAIAAELSAAIAEHRISRSEFKEEELDHETDIEFLLNDSGSDYRKKLVTKLVIEPTLKLLKESGVKPSRKLPLSRIALALFDLFCIANRDRASSAAVTGAWRKLNRQKASGV